MFGMNRHKNQKCFRKDKRDKGELSCRPTGLIKSNSVGGRTLGNLDYMGSWCMKIS